MRRCREGVKAPEFVEGLEWLNVANPLKLVDLRGKVVLLDFWTYCCINCMHTIPDLKKLEEKYIDNLVTIGVHSAKFTSEKETENIRKAILRFDIDHPVINDRNMTLWEEYEVHAWPTFVLIDPDGKIICYLVGEGLYNEFDPIIGNLIKDFMKRGKLNTKPLPIKAEREKVKASVLSFPAKAVVDEAHELMYVSDSGHNRILSVSLLTREIINIIGNGSRGFSDGHYDDAAFRNPQGIELYNRTLYVADTGNHSVRAVNLDEKTVTTIAGTGQQGQFRCIVDEARTVPLNSPWDLVVVNNRLYITMAGSNQIWRMELDTGLIMPHAGSGLEARVDGALIESSLAQPSGITTDGDRLFFVDAESSSVRIADTDPEGNVETLAGGDLYEFGDKAGRGDKARFQHPVGIVFYRDALYVTDTYNHKVKKINLETHFAGTFIGTGVPGYRDGDDAEFFEPSGITASKNQLYVADTNNNSIRIIDLRTRKVSTLRIIERIREKTEAGFEFAGRILKYDEQVVEPGEISINILYEFPKGYRLNPFAPSSIRIGIDDQNVISMSDTPDVTMRRAEFASEIRVNAHEGKTELRVDFITYYCREDAEGLCIFDETRVLVPVRVERGSAKSEITVTYEVPKK